MDQNNIDNINYYIILIKAYEESSKYDKVPFKGHIMYKILYIYVKQLIHKLPNFNFHNILYHLMEEQEKDGFIISKRMKKVIKNHQKVYFQTPIMYEMEKNLINLVKNY